MKRFFIALTLLALVGFGLPATAAEPSLHEVYQTANAGRLDDARAMMRDVLAAHPNSAKAHYVNAELLARQGQLKQASTELETAERLAPGLPFASQESVTGLKNSLRQHSPAHLPQAAASTLPGPGASGFPWGLLAAGLGVIAFIALAARLMAKRNPQPQYQGNGGLARPGFGNSANSSASPYTPPAPYGAPAQAYGGAAGAPAAGAGLGSQMLGGLATGVAVGAGVAAGQALMNRVMDGHKSSSGFSDLGPAINDRDSTLPEAGFSDLGGQDFGIADNSSWDDSGSSSDSDWN